VDDEGRPLRVSWRREVDSRLLENGRRKPDISRATCKSNDSNCRDDVRRTMTALARSAAIQPARKRSRRPCFSPSRSTMRPASLKSVGRSQLAEGLRFGTVRDDFGVMEGQ
jgi:hypothetical protein